MAHNSFIRTLGVWSGDAIVSVAEFEAFDLRQFQSINGDLGGAWAPSSIITIGGSGLEVSGAPFSADQAIFITMAGELNVDGVNLASIHLDNAAEMLVDNLSQIRLSGGKLLIQPTSELTISNTATVSIGNAVDLAYSSARTAVRRGLELQGTTVASGLPNSPTYSTNPDAWVMTRDIIQKELTSTVGVGIYIKIPELIDGATLTQLQIKTRGLKPTGVTLPGTFNTFLARRVSTNGTITNMMSGGAVTDQHATSGTWFSDQRTTTLTIDQNNVIDKSAYAYHVVMTPAVDAGGAQLTIEDNIATYSVPYVGHAQ